jgi:hypothetical protein
MHSDSFSVATLLAERGVDLASLGAAYLVCLATLALATAAFAAARHYLVIAPNRWARDFALYSAAVLTTALTAIVLENEFLPHGLATLHYVAIPQLLLLLATHVALWRRPEPWRVALAASATAATVVVGIALGLATNLIGPAYWVTLGAMAALVAFVWRQAVSTKRAFVTANSIYLRSKETLDAVSPPQTPWLDLLQWVALLAASLSLAAGNSLLRGAGLEEIPAVEVARESLLLLGATLLICAIPAASYWLVRKAWLPELTRFVWLVWLVVGFAFTYGNYLNVLARA